MGIDLLDISFHIEKSFGIRMPVDVWFDMAGTTRDCVDRHFDVSVGQLYEYLLCRLDESPSGFRPPRVSRDVLFDRLSRFFDVPPEQLEMETELDGLLGVADRQTQWSDLSRFLETRLPPLRRPLWLTASIGARAIATLVIGLSLTNLWNTGVGWGVALPVTGVVWLLALGITVNEATVLPSHFGSVAALYRLVNRTAGKLNPDRPGPWSREDVWHMLETILVECLAVDPNQITPEARLIADLGMS